MQLDNHNGSSEAEILKRISAARQQSEPVEPTEEVEAKASDDAPAEEVEADEVAKAEELEETEKADSEEPHEAEDEGQDSQEDDELYIELGDEEIPLSQVEEWKSGYMKDKDYRQKTMALAEQRKQFEAEREQFEKMQNQLKERIVELEAIVTEDESGIDWDELREYEPEKYIEQKEKFEKRKKAIEEAKKLRQEAPTSNVDVKAESKKFFDKHPEWGTMEAPTQQFEADAKLIQDYMQKQGFTNEEVQQIQTAHAWETVLRAARFDAKQDKVNTAKKKVRKAPVVTKPKKSAKTSLQMELEEAQARLRKTGSDADALKVRKLKRQLKR